MEIALSQYDNPSDYDTAIKALERWRYGLPLFMVGLTALGFWLNDISLFKSPETVVEIMVSVASVGVMGLNWLLVDIGQMLLRDARARMQGR